MEIIFFDIPSNPPAHRGPEFIDQSIFPKKLMILYIFKKKKIKTEKMRRVILAFEIVQTLLPFLSSFENGNIFF